MGAPGIPGVATSSADAIRNNQAMRAALLATAPRQRKFLGSTTASGKGTTQRMKLYNVGITTKVIIDVSMTYDVGTANATISPKGPFNLLDRVKLTDYDGTDRVNCTGFHLWLINCIRDRTIYGYNNESQTSVLSAPVYDLTVGTSRTMNFQLEIPLAYDEFSDLRGALLSQTSVGEAWLTIDLNNLTYANANADAVFNGAATTTISNESITMNVFQEYYYPQALPNNVVPIPQLDLMTVYELGATVKSYDNIAANAAKLINYPNQRQVLGMYTTFTNNGVMNAATTDISQFRLIANGNNVQREYRPRDKLFDQRLFMAGHADTRVGTYFELHRTQPIDTALYGNFQYEITPSSVSGTNTHMDTTFESFYTKGSLLPGFSQSAG